jgi:cobalt-zinc-cadmium efflux system membrane fusion protein
MPTRTQAIATTMLKQVPTALTLAVLALLAWWGRAHDWTVPKPSALLARLCGQPESEEDKEAPKPKEGESEDKQLLRPVKLGSPEAAAKAGLEYVKIEERPMGEYVTAMGEVVYNHHRIAQLSPRAAGTIWSVEKHEGDPIKRGDVLAVISAAEVARLKTDLQQALLQVEVRGRSLQMLQAIASSTPERQMREAEALLREARLRLAGDQQALLNLGLPAHAEELAGLPDEEVGRRLARLGLPNDVIRRAGDGALPANLLPMYAPFDGLVIHHEAVLGEVVTTTQPQFTVADVSRLMVLLNLRVEDANRVAVGQEVFFRSDAAKEEARGPLDWVSAEVDTKTRTVRARATVPNLDGRLRPRTFGTGRVLVKPIPRAVAVPDGAIQWEGKTAMVFVRQSATEYLPKPVTLGVRQDGFTQVLEGVGPGEEVVTTGSHVLRSEMLKERIGGDE